MDWKNTLKVLFHYLKSVCTLRYIPLFQIETCCNISTSIFISGSQTNPQVFKQRMSDITAKQDKLEVAIKNDFQKRNIKEVKGFVGKQRDEFFSKYPRMQETTNRDTFSEALKSKLEEFDRHNAELLDIEKKLDNGEVIDDLKVKLDADRRWFIEFFRLIDTTHAQELLNDNIGKNLAFRK